jgi:predicted transposase/invertase (TIGR01784 family)
MDQGIRKAQERVEHIAIDKEALRAYQMREMALSDYTSGINHAKREGKREGKLEGKREGKLEGKREAQTGIARKMKSGGVPAGQIAEYTGLSPGEIEQL